MTSDQHLTNGKVETTLNVEKQTSKEKAESPKFPRYSLTKLLKIAESIETNNAGKPYDRLDLAKSINMSPASSSFRMMITSSNRYGLTEGGYNADKISLTKLGSSIVAPTSDEEKKSALRQALECTDLFTGVYNYYDKKIVPREELLKNTLKREFNVDPEDVDLCYTILLENMNDFGLLQNIKGNTYLQLDKLGTTLTDTLEEKEVTIKEETAVLKTSESDNTHSKNEIKHIPKVFISHSKNANILEQLKTILEFGSFEYTIAEEIETAAIPIPDKIFGLMRECNCAIINVSADEELKNDEGVYRINENVLIEIGAAFVHYDKRVILLADKRVKLPSNLQGLYRCDYEGDELSFMIAMKLQKALTEFKKSLE